LIKEPSAATWSRARPLLLGLVGEFTCSPPLENLSGFKRQGLAMASHWEGLPVAFMEARALGLPVVTTAVGGLVDHITDGEDGLLVEPGSDDALVAALERVVTDADLRARLGAASEARADSFDATAAVARVEQRYERS
jgi:glycosyltransferase involved in cell wall biosynthesis